MKENQDLKELVKQRYNELALDSNTLKGCCCGKSPATPSKKVFTIINQSILLHITLTIHQTHETPVLFRLKISHNHKLLYKTPPRYSYFHTKYHRLDMYKPHLSTL